MIVKLLTEHHLEFLSLTGGCGGSSESTLVKMSNCWKSQSTAQLSFVQQDIGSLFDRQKHIYSPVRFSYNLYTPVVPFCNGTWPNSADPDKTP